MKLIKTRLSSLFTAAALVLMALPIGVSLRFSTSPTDISTQTFSYFSLTVLGYGDVFPLMTAITACISIVIYVIVLLTVKKHLKLRKSAMFISVFSACASVLVVLYEFMTGSFNIISLVISVLMTLAGGFVLMDLRNRE